MATTVYRWFDGDIHVTSTDADSAAAASRDGRRVTATVAGGN